MENRGREVPRPTASRLAWERPGRPSEHGVLPTAKAALPMTRGGAEEHGEGAVSDEGGESLRPELGRSRETGNSNGLHSMKICKMASGVPGITSVRQSAGERKAGLGRRGCDPQPAGFLSAASPESRTRLCFHLAGPASAEKCSLLAGCSLAPRGMTGLPPGEERVRGGRSHRPG